ncbi:MAG: GNAT family N-acetyltransferase [Tannerellaceae bacterium]|jgi:predicted acetyltransferase|nr:GNAT family N-acetyltransferase [Tannerellaceae bacterium]
MEEGKKKQVKRLWQTVFEDSSEFVRFYFEQVYKDENTLVIEKDGQVVSALQMLPYTMTFYGEEIPVAYISGASTLPSERGKGLMKQLLNEAVLVMEKRNIALSILIPAGEKLFGYYRSQGYETVFRYSTVAYRISSETTAPSGIRVYMESAADVATYSYFDRILHKRRMTVQHSYENFNLILKDMEIDRGEFYVARDTLNGNSPVGMAFVSNNISVEELLYDSPAIRELLLNEIAARHNRDGLYYRIPAASNMPSVPFGMARIIDAERLVNTWLQAHPKQYKEGEMRTMNVQELTAYIMGYKNETPYMSLMMD